MARLRSIEIEKRAAEYNETSEFNEHIKAESDVGIITSGVVHGYAIEAIKLLDIKASVLKLGMCYPIKHWCVEVIVYVEGR